MKTEEMQDTFEVLKSFAQNSEDGKPLKYQNDLVTVKAAESAMLKYAALQTEDLKNMIEKLETELYHFRKFQVELDIPEPMPWDDDFVVQSLKLLARRQAEKIEDLESNIQGYKGMIYDRDQKIEESAKEIKNLIFELNVEFIKNQSDGKD